MTISILLFFTCKDFTEPEPIVIVQSPPELPIPSVTITDVISPYFPGDTLTLEAALTDGSVDVQNSFFIWKLLNTSGAALNVETDNRTAYFVAFTPGEFVVSVTSQADTNKSEAGILNIIINPLVVPDSVPIANISRSDSVVVLGDSVLFDGTGSQHPLGEQLSFLWNTLNGGMLSKPDSFTTYFSAQEAGSYTITLRVNDTSMHESPLAFSTVTFESGSPPIIVIAPFDSILEERRAVTLDASQSYDPDSHEIFFSWQTLNGGAIENEDQPIATFSANEFGFYVVYLTVRDEFGFSTSKSFNFVVGTPSLEETPIACLMDSMLTTRINEPVELDASCSMDPKDLHLTYHWENLDGGILESPDSVKTQFIAGEAGTYIISLTVNNGTYSSKPVLAKVVVTPNQIPVANAGEDQSLRFGETAVLDGRQSVDPEGGNLTYLWIPLNGGTIADAANSTTTFTASMPGTYSIALTVNDGLDDSEPDIVNITFRPNQLPVANAGEDDSTFVNTLITLDGSSSDDPEDEPLTFFWKSLNGGILVNPGQEMPDFIAEVPMTYSILLKVFDGQDSSFADVVNITVIDTMPGDTVVSGPPPVAITGNDTTYLLNDADMVVLDGSGSFDPSDSSGMNLTYDWRGMKLNPTPFDNFHSPEESPIISLPQPGRYGFILTVSHNGEYSQPAQVVITVEEPDLYVSKSDPPDSIKFFRTITGALNAAQPNYVIFVKPEVYKENVNNFISNLTLLSTNRQETIIDGDGQGSTLHLNNVSGVTIRGFTIVNGGRSDPQEIDVANITCSNSASFIAIAENTIKDAKGDGIRIFNATNILISDSEIINNDFNGIRSSSGSFEVSDGTIAGNGIGMMETTGGISVETAPGGGSASNLVINIARNMFNDNEDNHLQLANDSQVMVEGNIFTGIGGGIISNDSAGVQLTVKSNQFLGTTGSPIFCRTNSSVTIEMNLFENQGVADSSKGIDFINCFGNVNANTVDGYFIGINLFFSEVTVSDNIIKNNDTGVKISGGPPCPIITENTYDNKIRDVDCDETTCDIPDCQ